MYNLLFVDKFFLFLLAMRQYKQQMPEFKTDCKTEVFLSLASNSQFVGQTF